MQGQSLSGGEEMNRIREEFDADRFGAREKTSEFPFGDQQSPVTCGICGETRYASKEFAEKVSQAISEGIDTPFVCSKCERDQEEMALAGR
jgi:hypothetical protein